MNLAFRLAEDEEAKVFFKLLKNVLSPLKVFVNNLVLFVGFFVR